MAKGRGKNRPSVKKGMAKAKAKGKHVGRPRKKR
jgi:hypothetical protein